MGQEMEENDCKFETVLGYTSESLASQGYKMRSCLMHSNQEVCDPAPRADVRIK